MDEEALKVVNAAPLETTAEGGLFGNGVLSHSGEVKVEMEWIAVVESEDK